MKTDPITEPKHSAYRLIIYSILILFMWAGVGEVLARTVYYDTAATISPLEETNYGPAIKQYQRINNYAERYRNPAYIFIGTSLVQTGINPDIFSQAYQKQTS